MLKPLGDRVVIQTLDREEVTKSGIFLPDTATKEQPQEGKVIEVGRGKTLENGQISELEVKKGDHVFFKKFKGYEIEVDGQEYLVLSEEDILAVITK